MHCRATIDKMCPDVETRRPSPSRTSAQLNIVWDGQAAPTSSITLRFLSNRSFSVATLFPHHKFELFLWNPQRVAFRPLDLDPLIAHCDDHPNPVRRL